MQQAATRQDALSGEDAAGRDNAAGNAAPEDATRHGAGLADGVGCPGLCQGESGIDGQIDNKEGGDAGLGSGIAESDQRQSPDDRVGEQHADRGDDAGAATEQHRAGAAVGIERGADRLYGERRQQGETGQDQRGRLPVVQGDQGRDGKSGEASTHRHAGLFQRKDEGTIFRVGNLEQDMGTGGIDRSVIETDQHCADHGGPGQCQGEEGETNGSADHRKLADAHRPVPGDECAAHQPRR